MGIASITRRLTRRRAQLTIFTSLALVCLLATGFLATQVVFKLDDYATASRDNVSWSLTQLEVDQLKLLAALQALDPEDNGSIATAHRRFDALYSRQNTVSVGRVYRSIMEDPKAQQAMQELRAAIAVIEPVMNGDDTAILDSRDVLVDEVRAMADPIRKLALTGLTLDAEAKERERKNLISKLLQVTVLSVLLLVALMSLTILLWRLFRLYRQRARENRQVLHRLSTILDTSQDAVLVVSPEGDIIDTNRAANVMFFGGGMPETPPQISDILLRKSADGAIGPVSGERLLASCADGPNLCANVMGQSSTGEVFPVELSADKAYRAGQDVVICFLRNISRRMADHAELLAARDKALSGEQAKARFLSMASHEMRTPLTGILGALDLLTDTPMTDKQKGYTGIMRASGQLLLNQINDALDVAQATQGALSVTSETFDLDAMLDTLLRSQTPEAYKNETTIRLNVVPGPMGLVSGDRNRVHQVLLNLVANAVKFTRHGEITIDVSRLDGENGPGDIIEFQIADTGVGIAEADQSAIFEDFVRLDAADAHSADGTGLGLGIVRTLVSLLGGEIGVESELGEGSLFWVRLPLPPARGQRLATDTKPLVNMGDPLDILIAEDNDINRQVIVALLRRDGHDVTQASNGQEAVDKSAGHKFDVILMDVNMPVLDGLSATRQIRAGNGASKDTCILALTAHVTPDIDAKVGNAGMDALLHKPLQRDDLWRALGLLPAQNGADQSVWLDQQVLAQLTQALSPQARAALLDGFESQGRALLDMAASSPEDILIPKVHELAGLAATLGARRLHAHLSRLESCLRADSADEASVLIDALPELWTRTQDKLVALSQAAA